MADQVKEEPKVENGVEAMETDACKALVELLQAHDLPEKVVEKLVEIHKKGKIQASEIDERALDGLKGFTQEQGLEVLEEFEKSSLAHVINKSSYLCGVMKFCRTTGKAQKRGPDEAKLKEILDRTGYTLEVTTGQRKYGGPPPDWEGTPPGDEHEIFCGKLPKEIYEDELIPLFEECGKIWDLRIMMDLMEGAHKGYCFVTFYSKEEAKKAVEKMNGYEIRPGKRLQVNISIPNRTLFVGNIPKTRSKEEIREEFLKHIDGDITNVVVYKNADEPNLKNRGFAFFIFDCHKSASSARRKLLKMYENKKKIMGCDILVDWADPQESPDEETMSRVKVLYVSNLTSDVTEESLKEIFNKYGPVERVKKLKDYAFVHYEQREDALKALENVLNEAEIGKNQAAVSLAKPQSESAQRRKEMRKRGRDKQFTMMHMQMNMPGPKGMPFGPDRGRGRFRRLPPPPPDYYGDYDLYGGYHEYRGGYNDPYADYSYEDYDYHWGGNFGRGGPRGGPRGGMMRGKMQRGFGPSRGIRRPMSSPRGRSGMPARGGPPMRGGRGRGAGGGDAKPQNQGGKRKLGGDHNQGGGKRRNVQDYNNQNWGAQPIAQQPLQQTSYNYEGDGSQWYTDSFGDDQGQNWS